MSETNTGVPQEVILSEARKARQEAEGAVRSYEVDIDETKKRVEMHYDQAGQMDYELSKVNKDLKRVLSLVEEIQGRGGEVPEKLGIALKQLEEAAERLKTDIGGLNKQIDEAARKRPEIIDVDEEAKSEQREYGRRKIGDNLRKIEEYRREIYRRDRIKEFLEMSDEKLQAAMDDWAQKHKDQGESELEYL